MRGGAGMVACARGGGASRSIALVGVLAFVAAGVLPSGLEIAR